MGGCWVGLGGLRVLGGVLEVGFLGLGEGVGY